MYNYQGGEKKANTQYDGRDEDEGEDEVLSLVLVLPFKYETFIVYKQIAKINDLSVYNMII